MRESSVATHGKYFLNVEMKTFGSMTVFLKKNIYKNRGGCLKLLYGVPRTIFKKVDGAMSEK